jgi:hypothetical protein
MSFTSIYISLLCFIHIVLWIVVFVGGFLNKKLIEYNLYIFLPFIYILQSFFPFHFIVRHKLQYIKQNIKDFKKPNKNVQLNRIDIEDIKRAAEVEKVSYDEMLTYFLIMKEYEHTLILPRLLDYLKNIFDYAFRNPFDAPQMIIIGFIINLYLLKM